MAFLRLIRIGNLFFVALFQLILRYCVVLPVLERSGVEPMLTTTNFIILIIATVTLTASGNVINDYFDVKADRINHPESVVVDKHIERRTVVLIHVILTLLGVLCGLYISFVFRKETYAFLFVAIPAILWFYSTHFKKQMLIGNLIVALLVAVTACLVASVEFAAIVSNTGESIINTPACEQAWSYTMGIAFFAFVTNLSREIVKDMEDVEGDVQCGCHTLPADMGIKYSKYIVIAIEIVMLIALWASYALFDIFSTIPLTKYYFAIALSIPTIIICIKLACSSTRKQFHTINLMCKFVMLAGVVMPLILYLQR